MNYTTQMDVARRGILTKELKKVAEKEKFDIAELMKLVVEGKIAIPINKRHQCLEANGIDPMLKTKISVNLGTFRDCMNLDMGLGKVNDVVRMGAGSTMDLSPLGDIRTFRKELIRECPAMIGMVPTCDTAVYYHKPLKDITSQEWIDTIEVHVEDGVDFQIICTGTNRRAASRFKKAECLTNIVSRGGSVIFAWIEMIGQESPFYEHFDRILDTRQEYSVTLSLRDTCRPGCIADASNISQIEELVTLGEFTQRAWDKNVQVIIEESGHMPLNQIEANMKTQQTICKGAPLYVLGPLVTDIAPGYGHITAAIGGALAATNDASFLRYVTPVEHLRLPDMNDVKEGVIAPRIATHAADTARRTRGATQWDHETSATRKNLDWERMFGLSLDSEKARSYRESAKSEKEDTCSMCGNFCAVKNMSRILNKEIVSIFNE